MRRPPHPFVGNPMSSFFGPIHALVVGGDRQFISEQLSERLGAEPFVFVGAVEAETLADACHVLRTSEITLIVVGDDVLGGNAGRPIGALTQLAPHAPLVVVDKHNDERLALEYIRLGAADVIAFEDLKGPNLEKTVGRVLQRQESGSTMLRQISDFLLCNSYEGTIALDLQLRVIVWNPALERIFELLRAQVLGQVITDVLPCFKQNGEAERLYEVLNGKTMVSRDRTFHNPATGKTGYFNAYYTPMRNQSGQVIGVIGLIRDVSKRKQAERSSQENAQRLLAVTNSSPNLIWISNAEGERIFFNKRWLELTGSTLSEETGAAWRRHIHPEDMKRYLEAHNQAAKDMKPTHMEVKLKCSGAGGRFIRFFESALPIFLSDGTFIGFVGYCTDINATQATSQAQAVNQQLGPGRPEHSRTYNTLDMAPIGVLTLDSSLIITQANKQIANLFEKPVTEIIGKRIEEVFQFSTETFARVLEKGEKIQIENYKVLLPGKDVSSVKYFDVACWPIKDRETNMNNSISMSLIEVTDRYNSVRSKEDFVAALVHDLKTPLLGAERTLEAMLNGALGPVDNQHSEILNILRASNRSLVTMVQSVIDVYRCENDLLNLSLQSVSMFNLALNCLQELSLLFEHKGINLSHNLSSQKEAGKVLGDPMALRRVIVNLLDNALKFTPAGGSVHLMGMVHGDSVLLHVTDTGLGIPLAEQAKVFSKCWQGNAGRQYQATAGLGLYLCRQIVRAHNGEITLVSRPERGSTFTIELPLFSSRRSAIAQGSGQFKDKGKKKQEDRS
ncbi:MAG TPA: PAS domain-containing protein [Candidatus Obscuribacterales bacterium]